MPLTIDQRSDLQGDLGIGFDQTIFTDHELDRAYTRAASNYDLTLAFLMRQLAASPKRLMFYFGTNCPEDQQKSMRAALMTRLTTLEKALGLTNAPLQVGSIDLSLDFDEIDYLTLPPPYSPEV